MKKRAWLLGLSLCVGCASMKTTARQPASAMSADQGKTAIKELLRTKLFTPNRPLIGFHYDDGAVHADPASGTEARSRMTAKMASFADLSRQEDEAAGPGFYVAIDPNQTRSYGGQAPELYAATIGARAIVLNGVDRLSDSDSQTYVDGLRALGCANADLADQMVLTGVRAVSLLRYDKTSSCQSYIADTLKELGVQAILYTFAPPAQYPSNQHALVDCRANRGESLNVIDPLALDHFAYFSNATDLDPAHEASVILSLYLQSGGWTTAANATPALAPPRSLMTVSPAASSTFVEWRNQEVYKCGPPWPPESAGN